MYKEEIGFEDYASLWEALDIRHDEVEPGIYILEMRSKQGGAHNEWIARYDLVRQREDQIRKELCERFNLSYPEGCAVHCTCDFEQWWAAFCEENCHDPDCPIVKPNFLHKPTGFNISWYKYPMRSSFMNENLSVKEFAKIIDNCIESLV